MAEFTVMSLDVETLRNHDLAKKIEKFSILESDDANAVCILA